MAYKLGRHGDCEWFYLSPDDSHRFRAGKWKFHPQRQDHGYRIVQLSKDLPRLTPHQAKRSIWVRKRKRERHVLTFWGIPELFHDEGGQGVEFLDVDAGAVFGLVDIEFARARDAGLVEGGAGEFAQEMGSNVFDVVV